MTEPAMTEFEKVCDFENLYRAHRRARRGKREKTEVALFEMNLSKNLWEIKEQLEDGTYQMKGYYSFVLYEPKERRIYAPYYPDRVVQHCLTGEVIQPILSRKLIYDNSACQPGKGTHFTMKRMTKFMSEFHRRHGQQGYFLKCDIRSYFNSIDHEVLKQKLRKAIEDPDVGRLMDHYIDSFEVEPGKGIPHGCQTSQWFAIYYMDSLDRLVKEELKIKYYSRYMDDLVLLHESRDYLKECLVRIREHVENDLKMELNNKTQMCPIKNGVEYVGFRFYMTETGKIIKKMKPASKRRMKRRLKKLQKDYASGKIEMEKVKSVIASYSGHLKHGNMYMLKQKIFNELTFSRNEKVREAREYEYDMADNDELAVFHNEK